MSVHKIRAATALALLALAGCGDSAPAPTATAMSVDDFACEPTQLYLAVRHFNGDSPTLRLGKRAVRIKWTP